MKFGRRKMYEGHKNKCSSIFVDFAMILGTFSTDDENADDDVYDRFRPGKGPSSTAGNINTLAHRLRGRVLYCLFEKAKIIHQNNLTFFQCCNQRQVIQS